MTVEDLDHELRALTVHDVSPERAERMRSRCVGVLTARARRAGAGMRPLRDWRWLEPLAALSVSALYLAAALKAATVLMALAPKP
jgi:hypothetical protein